MKREKNRKAPIFRSRRGDLALFPRRYDLEPHSLTHTPGGSEEEGKCTYVSLSEPNAASISCANKCFNICEQQVAMTRMV